MNPAPHLTDEQLIQLYLTTQQNYYFEQLYHRYANKVFRRCVSLTKCEARAEDYMQDIFLRVHLNIGKFKEQSTFSTWLYAISYNYCLDQIRLAGRLTTVSLNEAQAAVVPDETSPDPTEEEYVSLLLALRSLPTEEMTLLRLKYEQDLDIKELAQRYNLSYSAVKMRLKRARDRIREQHACRLGR